MSDLSILTPREQAVFDAIERAARAGEPCPDNMTLACIVDCESLATPVRNLQMLEKKGFVRVTRYQRARQVTIVASGLSTRAPADTTAHWRARSKETRGQWRDRLAAHMADGGTFRGAAEALGRSPVYIRQLWAEICHDLGWQAQ